MAASSTMAPGNGAPASPAQRAHRGTALARLRSFFSLSLLANHFPELHGMRVVAILGVLQFHVTTMFADARIGLNDDWINFTMSIFFGMDLFFVLSGFLIGTMILHAVGADKRQRPLRFYARRSFRIFPLYYVVLTFLAFVLPLNPVQKANLWREYVYLTNTAPDVERWTLVMNYGWSLCVEEHFYLVAPLIIWILAKLRGHTARLLFLTAFWFSATVIRLWVVHHHPRPWTDGTLFQAVYVRTWSRYDTIIAGVLLAYLNFHFADRWKRMFEEPKWRRIFGGTSLVCLWILLFPRVFGEALYWDIRALSYGTLTSVMYVAYVLLLLHGNAWGKRFFSAPIFLHIATLGYGIYLVHMPLFDHAVLPLTRRMIDKLGMTLTLVWPISLALLWLFSAAVAWVLHVFIEKPSLLLRDRWAP